MLTFTQYVQKEGRDSLDANLGQNSKRARDCRKVNLLDQGKAAGLHLSKASDKSLPLISDLTTRFSKEILRLNDAMFSDASCSSAEQRLSELLLNLHYLILIAISGGSYDRLGAANKS